MSNDPEMTVYDIENCLEQIKGHRQFRHEKLHSKEVL